MNHPKIKGHQRIWKEIDEWVAYNQDLDIDYLLRTHRSHVKVWVSPYSDLSSGRKSAVLKGKTRKKVLAGLLDIFNQWEKQLKTLETPYYLALWLYEPHLHKSQVVCSIGSCLDFYDKTFYKPELQKQIPVTNYGHFSEALSEFNWTHALDETFYTPEDFEATPDEFYSLKEYRKHKKWAKRKLKENPRTVVDPISHTTYYFVPHGRVWIGQKNG
ncbi:hypothetical protein [Lacinutrix sp. Hel_I_90]|uniref:hypothetical protein n=1 Tax=Lacinutrix sp. Hel_I_90 TaxID=1249999 RepID=UPI0005CA85DA|nr:hypothetical protein [Lacinutrix sp. Hel_I_90]